MRMSKNCRKNNKQYNNNSDNLLTSRRTDVGKKGRNLLLYRRQTYFSSLSPCIGASYSLLYNFMTIDRSKTSRSNFLTKKTKYTNIGEREIVFIMAYRE